MIRFFLFYFYIIHYRAFRLFFRQPFTGDTNYCSSPLLTVRRILSHQSVASQTHFVDIGCGEGLVGLFVRFWGDRHVVLHDVQSHFLTVISFFCRLFFVSRVMVSSTVLEAYPSPSVFFCVWSTWSSANRKAVLARLLSVMPRGSVLVSVGVPLSSPALVEIDKISETFAWGKSNVYYYNHA